jgi:Flp pilus assembly pilin Flp
MLQPDEDVTYSFSISLTAGVSCCRKPGLPNFGVFCPLQGGTIKMFRWMEELWSHEDGQDIAEYAVMLAVILVIVVGTIRLIGGNANNVFSSVASSIAQ